MMHYYFDVLANLDECIWEFYEWENTDNLTPIKKVPLIRVSDKKLVDFLTYQIVFDSLWIETYKEKAVLKNNKEKPLLILFSSTKNSVLLEMKEDGTVMYRSKLLIEDEINCNEIAYSLKEMDVPYKIGEKLLTKEEFRRAREEKRILKTELKTIKEHNNIEKCSYLYFEWFGYLEKELNTMILKMEQELVKPYSLKMHQITELIKLSYKGQL